MQNSVGPDIPPIEIANAAKQVLIDQISLSKDDLIREPARLFSFSKVGSIVDTLMRQGIELAVANGYAKEQNGRIVCLNVEFISIYFLKTCTSQVENICLEQLITGNNLLNESDAIFLMKNLSQIRFCYVNRNNFPFYKFQWKILSKLAYI